MGVLDRRAVAVGACIAVVISLPAGVLGQVVVDDRGHSPALVLAFLLPVLAGFAAGGYVAARHAPTGPLANSAVAAVAAFALIQGLGVVRRLVVGAPLSLPSLVFAAFLAYSSGLLGGLVAQRVGGRRRLDRRS